MSKVLLEYIWLDGYDDQNLRSKTKIVTEKSLEGNKPFPDWSFDGSSTNQAKGSNTDCLLKPVFSVIDPFRGAPHQLVLCEVLNPDGTPHNTNARVNLNSLIETLGIDNTNEFKDIPWFGWEQEYTLTKKRKPFAESDDADEKPLGFEDTTPRPQGEYYCGIGVDNVVGRSIVEEHMVKCLNIGLDISGINAEVMLGQWEYQIGPVGPLNGSDQLWISRYILHRVAEKYGVKVSFHPKPLSGDWNGSGCHVNFSTKEMREDGGIDKIKEACELLKLKHNDHINVYGLHNDKRMTGKHETSSIHEFSYGESTRNTSIRIPAQTIIDKKGYFEDRRPASNCDPYKVSKIMLETINKI